MGNPQGFIKIKREKSEYRPVCERVTDYEPVFKLRTDSRSRDQAALRIGRYGKSIANTVTDLSTKPHIANLMSIPHMADLVIDMVDDAIAAYESDNLRLIEDLSSRDDTIDALRHSIFREGITYMMEDPKSITRCTNYILVARYLERCADHACKIAENVYYMETGERTEIK